MSGSIGGGWQSPHPRQAEQAPHGETRGTEPARPTDDSRANGAVSPTGSSGAIGPAAPAGDLGAFCPAWRTLDSRLKGVDAQAGPTQLRASVAAARAAFDPALGAAPGQVRGDVQVVTDSYGRLFAALDQAGYDGSRVSLGAIQGFSPSVVNAAAARVASYAAADC